LFFRVFTHATFRQLIAEQIKSRKPAKPADGIRRKQTSALGKAWAMVKSRHALPRGRASVFLMNLYFQANTSFDPNSIMQKIADFRVKKQNLG